MKLPANIPVSTKGECRGRNQYVVCPGSYVPCDEGQALDDPQRGYYTVEVTMPPTSITFDELPEVFKEKVRQDEKELERQKTLQKRKFKPQQGNRHSRLFDLTISEVVGVREEDGVRFAHPLHDSKTGSNFMYSRKKNGVRLAHCWRHNVVLNPLQFLAVKSGYLTCDQAGKGHSDAPSPSYVVGDDGAIFHAWLQAKKDGLIPDDDPIPVNALHYIAREHKVCPVNMIPGRGEFPNKKLPHWAYNICLDIVEEGY